MRDRAGRRPLRFAGRLYPAAAVSLEEDLARHTRVAAARSPDPSSLLLVPHGSLEACGDLVVSALDRLPEGPLEVTLLGPCHDPGALASEILEDPREAWDTLHGAVDLLPSRGPGARQAENAHDREHSLEMLVCLLAARGSLAGIRPLLLTPGFREAPLRALVDQLESWLAAGPQRALLCTTDLDHFLPGDRGRQSHALCLDRLGSGDPASMWDLLASGRILPCGGGAMWVFMELCRRTGRRVRVLGYGWAGEAVGGAVGFTSAVAAPP